MAAELAQDKGAACGGRAGDRTVQDCPSYVRASPYCQPPLSAWMPLAACLGEETDVLGKLLGGTVCQCGSLGFQAGACARKCKEVDGG